MLCLLLLAVLGSFCSASSPGMVRSECEVVVPKCERVQAKDCFGARLPYQRTAPGAFTTDIIHQQDVHDSLQLWTALRTVPQCWEVIQPLLCSVYLPPCKVDGTSNNSLVQKPSREQCDIVRTRCRIVDLYGGWPEFLKCDQKHFTNGCLTNMLLVKVNNTKSCFPPLVATKSKTSWYPYIDGCGLQCKNVLFTEADHSHAHIFIALTGSLCFFCTLFTVLTFILDWKSLHRYPAIILFFINVSFFIGTVGWLAQFIPGARRDIVCRKDGTVRKAEPQIGSAGESASCTVIFVIIYYFTMTAVVWFAILAYTWHLTFRTYNSKRDVIEGRKGYFHLIAWSLPLVLTIVCLAITQVDGDSVTGICFVGYVSHVHRAGFVLVPVGLSAVVGLVFLARGLITLIKLQTQSPGLMTSEAAARIHATIIRISVFASCVLVLVVLTFAIHAYVFLNESTWQLALRDYLVCMANNTVMLDASAAATNCHMSSRPTLAVMELHVFTYFCAGVAVSSWIWQKSTVRAWKCYLKRWFCATTVESLSHETKMMIDKLDPMAVSCERKKPKQRDVNVARSSLSFVGLGEDPFVWSAALPYGIHRGSRAPTPLMLQHGGFGRLQRRYSESDLQSVTSIWTQSQHEQQTANVMIHSPLPDDQSARAASSTTPQQPTAPSSTDSRQSRRKLKNIRQLLSNRVAPLSLYSNTTDAEDGSMSMAADRHQLDLPVYSKFIACSRQTEETDSANIMAAGSSDIAYSESNNNPLHSPVHIRHDISNASEEDDNSTVAAESERMSDDSAAHCAAEDVVSNDAEDDSETDARFNSNYSIASSDTAALSIKLDENYDPVIEQVAESTSNPIPPSTAKVSATRAVVRPLESRRSNIPVLHASASLPTSAATSKSNSATQTSIVHPPLSYYQQPFPYPLFGYGGYLPPMPPVCETPIWPPYAYAPPLPWYYGGPHFDPMQYMPAAPPYCVVPPSATTGTSSNQSSLPHQTESTRMVPDSQPASTVEPSKPTVVPPSSFHEPAASATDKLFQPIATRSCFRPTAGSLFKPVTSSENSGRRQISCSEPAADEKLSHSLLEMVELITPQMDSGTDHTSDNSEADDDDDDAEDEAEREAWEAAERERQRIRKRHTRQWMRALRTDVDQTQLSDTSL